MKSNSYIINRQQLLRMVWELHECGFEKLRVIPSMSPSGAHWRCKFIASKKDISFTASNWICNFEDESIRGKIKQTPKELADLFLKENLDFLEQCKGDNKEYVKWFAEMVENLNEDELPYAFTDYFPPSDFWRTTDGNEIKTLPNEKDYYLI